MIRLVAPLWIVVALVAGCASGGMSSSKKCVEASTDCPATESACTIATCSDGTCATDLAAVDTPCNDAGGKLCDGAGQCVECTNAERDCPAPASECAQRACNAGRCETTPVAASTPTASGQTAGDCKLVVCDGAGGMMAIDDNDPANDGNDCTTDACASGVNTPTAVAAGTACATSGGAVCGSGTKLGTCVECISNTQCAAGGNVCDTVSDHFVCVAPTCMDTMTDGMETDVDCGGPTCSPCTNGLMCSIGGDCASGYCAGTTCAACGSSTDCPGTSFCDTLTGTCVPDQMDGLACGNDDQCTSGHCVDGVCCNLACNGLCEACTAAKKGSGSDGTCGNIGGGSDPDTECAGTYSCNGSGACQSCSDSAKDGDETDTDCGGPTCGKCADGQMCTSGTDCVSGACPSGTCVANVCGDGVIRGSEQCDDNNTNNADGCSGTCVCEISRSVQVGPGLNLAIPDGSYAGTLASMACTTISVSAVNGCNQIISGLNVKLGMNHTWVGDLVIKLVSPGGTTVTLMSRPGLTETSDNNAGGCCGNSADLVNAGVVTFIQSASTSAENMGASGANVCQGDGICQYIPNYGVAPAGNLFSFNGQPAAGSWKLCVGDASAADTGSIDMVTLSFSYQ